MTLQFQEGHLYMPELKDDSVWSGIYGDGSWEQDELDKVLTAISRDPSKKPPRQPGMYGLDDCQITALILRRAAYEADDRQARFAYGWLRAAEIAQVARVLSEQRPKRNEDVVYWRGVGVRMSLRKGTDDLIKVSPGLIESFVWDGEFGLACPLWPRSIMGVATLESGESFANALAALGIECDAAAMNVVLDFGLRAELLAMANE